MNERAIITNPDGSVGVLVPAPNCGLTFDEICAKDIPAELVQEKVTTEDIPSDRTFRNAWTTAVLNYPGKRVGVDMDKGKEIAHDLRRAKRENLFAPHDEIISKQIPGKDANAAEAARQVIRDADAVIQTNLDACTTPDEMKAIIDAEGL